MPEDDDISLSLHRGQDVLPKSVFDAFLKFVATAAKTGSIGIVCAVILDFGKDPHSRVIKIQFSPQASSNPYMGDMCRDIGESFQRMGDKFDAMPGRTQ